MRQYNLDVHGHLEALECQDDIRCPYCTSLQDNDDGQYPTTLHGEGGWEDFHCQDCNMAFQVKENVLRDWDVAKGPEKQEIQDELDKKLDDGA